MHIPRSNSIRALLPMLFLLLATTVSAVPAKRGVTRQLTLSDGSVVQARLVGDEFAHYWLSDDGRAFAAEGNSYHAINLSAIREEGLLRRAEANSRRTARLAPRRTRGAGYFGKKRGIIILVNFSNLAFKAEDPNTQYQRIANEKNFVEGKFKGSMYDYFYAQSEGQFDLEFDVVGPFTLSKNQAYYGANNVRGDDKHPAEMVSEACLLADSLVNYADYDWDSDGYVDQVYVVYAGKGEADGGPAYTIWPHEWELEAASFYGDGPGALDLDGVKVNTYATGNELEAATNNVMGIGTMCHEFSHCLGYPDFYDTDYSGGQGMGSWDLMDNGSYNGDGFQPAGYTSYERWVAGWREPIVLDKDMEVRGMKSLQEGGDFYIIYNDGNRNEYFLLENRQKTGWDASVPGHGLLILHVDYDARAWSNNTPNDNPSHQRMTWVAADNNYQYYVYQGTKYYTDEGMSTDPFPYRTTNSFSSESAPDAKFFNKTSNGSNYMDWAIRNISEESGGTMAFDFKYVTIATPTFSVPGGTYSGPQSVEIICRTNGATIRYTTDGTEPTRESTEYTEPIAVENTMTIKAFAYTDEEESRIVEATYKIKGGHSSASNYKRATKLDELANGMHCIIANTANKKVASDLNGTYLKAVDTELTDNLIEIDNDFLVLQLIGSGDQYALLTPNNEYLSVGDTNQLGITTNQDNWTLHEEDGIIVLEHPTHGYLLYTTFLHRFVLNANGASKSMPYAELFIEDPTSGISTPHMAPATDNQVYTLTGMRVTGPLSKGIYIVNGKKVIRR